jgi:CheY-like chemotaxis protein
VARDADPGEKKPSPTRQGSLSETVLVVEDDDDVRSFTVETLRELGYRVMEAHDGEAALRLLEKQDQPVQLLLTDVVMPVLSGDDLALLAVAVQPSLRVLFTSGYTRDAIMKDGRLAAGVDLLSKPFTHASLAARVRDVLDR